MQKVLIIGPYFHNYNQSIESAFINLGFDTKVMDYHIGTTINFKEKIAYNLSFDKKKYFLKKRFEFNQKLQKTYLSYNPDIVFIIHGNEILEETILQMKSSFKILWMMDSLFRAKNTFKIKHLFDKIFVFEKSDIEKLYNEEKIVAHFMPLAVDEKIYKFTSIQKNIDILFIGALYGKRIEILEKIITAFPDKIIKIYGQFYSPFKRPIYHLTRKYKSNFLNKNVTPSQANELYNSSKICLNIHHDQSKFGVNQRFFEILGSGNLQLVDRNDYLDSEFKEIKILTYQNDEELINSISDIFSHKIDPIEYTDNAYQCIITHHTFTHRIQQILALSNCKIAQ